MIREVELGPNKVSLDTIKLGILEGGTVRPGWIGNDRSIANHIIVAIKNNAPYILKALPHLEGDARGDGFCFIGLSDSRGHLTARYAGSFVQWELGWVDKMYILDSIKDLVEFLEQFIKDPANEVTNQWIKLR
jgi:hypothetical protein